MDPRARNGDITEDHFSSRTDSRVPGKLICLAIEMNRISRRADVIIRGRVGGVEGGKRQGQGENDERRDFSGERRNGDIFPASMHRR